jgi:acetone carboxylase gamma subunit
VNKMREHDPLCRSKMQQWEEIQVGYCPDCDLIAKVREDERNK